MSDKRRIPLHDAEQLAAELVELLEPACDRIEVAGSIRRRRPDVGDVEIVCQPRQEPLRDFFGLETGGQINFVDEACDVMLSDSTLAKRLDANGRPRWGSRYKAAIFQGFAVDLFCVLPPAQFGTIFVIRTGPAAFSHRLVTARRDGGWMPDWLSEKDGHLRHRDGTPLVTPNEEDVFQALGLPFVEPQDRTDSWRPARVGAAW